jgi:ethanolamine permease
MSKSGLLPACLAGTYGDRKTPVVAMMTTAAIGICVLLPLWGFNPGADDLYELCMIGACCVYIAMFWCFIVFKVRYDGMDRTFTNPLGIASAVYGICYFLLVLFTLLFAQLDFNALCAFVPYIVLSVVYYFKVVESRQFFSKDEQQKFMKAYILNGK